MKLTAGARLTSAICNAQVVVIRPPASGGVLACGGQPMAAQGETAPEVAKLSDGQEGRALPGKRYVDEDSGLEVLCAKAGFGALAFEGRPLKLKEAKPLPASD